MRRFRWRPSLVPRHRGRGGGVLVFVFVQLSPSLLFAEHDAGGRRHGRPRVGARPTCATTCCRTGGSPAGRPTGTRGSPPRLLLPAADAWRSSPLDVVLPYGVAFKFVTVSGLVALPVAALGLRPAGRHARPGPGLPRRRRPCRSCSTAATRSTAATSRRRWPASSPSPSASPSPWCSSASGPGPRHRAGTAPWPPSLLAVTGLCHIIPTFFAVVGAVVLTLMQPSAAARSGSPSPSASSARLLAAFWIAAVRAAPRPTRTTWAGRSSTTYLQGRSSLANLRQWLGPARRRSAPWSSPSCMRRRGRARSSRSWPCSSVAGFRFMPEGRLWNARLLPFWFLCLFLLAGVAVAEGGRGLAWLARGWGRRARRRSRPQAAAVVSPCWPSSSWSGYPLARAALRHTATADGRYDVAGPHAPPTTASSPAWAKWNYSGYERKAAYPEYHDIITTMDRVGPRVRLRPGHWEYEAELDQHGTPMALMLLPYWTDGCIGSMEGLYFESSATTPYHFLIGLRAVASGRRGPSATCPTATSTWPGASSTCSCWACGTTWSFSEEAKAMARQQPRPELVDDDRALARHVQRGRRGGHPRPHLGGLRGQRLGRRSRRSTTCLRSSATSARAAPGVAGRSASTFWQDRARWDVPLAAGGPTRGRGSRRRRRDPPRRARAPGHGLATSARATTASASTSTASGTPVLVKTSYFPNWQASGADGPWRVTPNLMVVVPTSRHVELHYGVHRLDLGAMGLTALGLAGLAALSVVDRRRRRREAAAGPPPTGESVDVPCPASWCRRASRQRARRSRASPDEGASPPAQDGGARRSPLGDVDGDLDDGEPGPLGPEHELGVEQVGAECDNARRRCTRARAIAFMPWVSDTLQPEAASQHERRSVEVISRRGGAVASSACSRAPACCPTTMAGLVGRPSRRSASSRKARSK